MEAPGHILIIQGHPDAGSRHFGHALADAYADAAGEAGHEVRRIDVASVDFPLLRSQQEWEHGELPPSLAPAQEAIRWSSHIVILFPLWLGTCPRC
jgi:putative NADPH-quinone reductase